MKAKKRIWYFAGLNAQRKLDTDINIPGHLDHFGELNRFFSGTLQVFDTENLQTRLIDLENVIRLLFL
jgi:hypothetical protein